jgi:hypothetical protein
MSFFGILRGVALIRTDVSEEISASIIRVTIICELGTTLAVTSNDARSEEYFFALGSSETSILTRETHRNIPEDDILQSHCRENPKSYIALTGWTL